MKYIRSGSFSQSRSALSSHHDRRCQRRPRGHSADAAPAPAGTRRVRPRRHLPHPRRGLHLSRCVRRGGAALRHADRLRPPRRRALLPRLRGQPHGTPALGRPRGVLHGDAARRAGAGALRVPPLGELPLRRGARHGAPGRRPRGKAGGAAWLHRPRGARALGRGAADHRSGAERNIGLAAPDRGGIGEGPDRTSQRRR